MPANDGMSANPAAPESQTDVHRTDGSGTGNMRWWILGFITAATALNYLDRQSLPVVIGVLDKEFPITDQKFGELNSWFLLAYGIMYAVGGRLMDALGTRLGYALIIVWWSIATFLQGTASSVLGFGVYRFLLGMGEGGAFPGSAKAVSEWFSARQRSFAFGVFNTGSALGAVMAPPLIALIVVSLNWRWVFFITGAAGFVWAVAWLAFCPKGTPTTAKPSNPIPQDQMPAEEQPSGQRSFSTVRRGWIDLFSHREVWGLLVAKALTDSAWFFFIFWMPKYLYADRGLDIQEIGYFAWIPWVAAGFGSFGAGWLSSQLLRYGLTLDQSRKLTLGVSALLVPALLLVTASPLGLAIVFFCLVYWGHQSWATILQTLPADMFPPERVGSAAGLLGAAGSLAATGFSLLAGSIVGNYGYAAMFLIAGVLHPLSFLIVLVTVPRIKRIA